MLKRGLAEQSAANKKAEAAGDKDEAPSKPGA